MNIINTPRTVGIAITNQCNLRCTYCSHFSSAGDVEGDLATDQWLTFFQELGRCTVLDVVLEGGEPFVRQDLPQLIAGIVENHMRFSILSNGTLITEEIAEFLASTHRCDNVQVSIDGSVPETHEACRGEGNFSKAIQGITVLQKYVVPVTVRVTIHRHNVKELGNIAQLLLEDIGIPGFSTNSASYLGLCRQYADEIALTVEERSLAMEELLRLDKKYDGRIAATAGPLAEAKMWVEMQHAQESSAGRLPGRGYLKACGGVFSKIDVRADGVMVPCGHLSHIPLGKINFDALRDVWQNHPELNRLRQRGDIPLDEIEFCQGCRYTRYCTGNCPALAYTQTGVDSSPDPNSCLRKFLEEGGKLPNVSF